MIYYCKIIFDMIRLNCKNGEWVHNEEKIIFSEEVREKTSKEDHDEAMKNLKYDNQQKTDKLIEILTTPKQSTSFIAKK